MGSWNTILIKKMQESVGKIINIYAEKMNDSEENILADFKLKTKHSNIINYSDTKNKLNIILPMKQIEPHIALIIMIMVIGILRKFLHFY